MEKFIVPRNNENSLLKRHRYRGKRMALPHATPLRSLAMGVRRQVSTSNMQIPINQGTNALALTTGTRWVRQHKCAGCPRTVLSKDPLQAVRILAQSFDMVSLLRSPETANDVCCGKRNMVSYASKVQSLIKTSQIHLEKTF